MIGDPERSNLSMRTSISRLARLKNAFSKKWEHLKAMLAVYVAYYNFCRIHSSIRCTPRNGIRTYSARLECEELTCCLRVIPSLSEGHSWLSRDPILLCGLLL